jgi:hypothetical protein
VTETGARLAETERGSQEEATLLVRAVLACPTITQVAGDLISDSSTKQEIAQRIRVLSGLS